MKTSVCFIVVFCINDLVSVLVIITSNRQKLIFIHSVTVVVNKSIAACIVRRVDIDNLYFSQVCFLQQLQYLKVISLNVEVFCIVKVNAFLSARAESFVYRCIGKKNGLLLVRPSKLIAFFVTVNDLAGNLLHKHILINSTDYLAVFVNRLCYGIGEHSCQLLEILISLICRLHFQFIHYACPP